MRNQPAVISLFTVLFFVLSLTGNILITDSAFSSIAQADDKHDGKIKLKKSIKKKKKNRDKDKDDDKGSNGVKKQIHKLQAQITTLQQQVDNIELTPGPVGPQGPAGNDGATGPQGPKGDQGIRGVAGANGIDGAAGPQGVAGLNGKDGVDGVDGKDGAEGPQGPAGNDGVDGAQGIQGVKGDTGNTGADGADGAQGIQGPKGDTGADGKDGSSSGYVLLDTNGNLIGGIMGFDMEQSSFKYLTHIRYLKTNGEILNVALYFDWFGKIRNVDASYGETNKMYFSSRDCKGTPYILTNSNHNRKSKFGSHFPDTVAIDNGNKIELYVAETNQAPQFINTTSRNINRTCENKGLGDLFIPAEKLDSDLLTTFPPPFNVVPIQ